MGTSLNSFQIAIRGITVFILALILIRILGRRSFGIASPLDNIIVILLGAVLSGGSFSLYILYYYLFGNFILILNAPLNVLGYLDSFCIRFC
ncbi:uncharacterized membrane protein YcaP (DUF421 family) [Chryseobacterium sediminis]|nr:uncharacterized membrane protein YcaP (DUF421 family) [Chryseobacterium sediminis]